MFFTLAVVPVLIGIYISFQQRRIQAAERFTQMGFDSGNGRNRSEIRRHIPPGMFLIGLIVLLIALARPQMVVSLPHQEGTVILAFDVSGSMAATDFDPNRIEAAKTAARDFVTHQPSSIQIGIVAFSDSGYSIVTPTNDQESLLASIKRLAPQKGTSLGNGILAALNTIARNTESEPLRYSLLTQEPTATPTPVPKGVYTPAVIVLLTDGENNETPDPLDVAQKAADRGVRIFTIGIGTPGGTILKANGFTVRTRLNETLLQQIAQITGGSYSNAENEKDLVNIYDHLNLGLVVKPEKTEVTALLAGVSILIFIMGGLLSLVWFGRVP
jgi:Ca-activated chloride channel family protein